MRFIGMSGFYRRYIPHYAKRAAPLYKLMRGYELPKRRAQKRPDDPYFGTEKDTPFPQGTWTEEHEHAFATFKKLLSQAPVLQPPDFSKRFIVETDASNLGLGAVLLQAGQDKIEHPICYLSRALTDAEKNYDTSNKEGLGVVWACSELRPYLYGKPFTIRSDHQPLKWALNLSDPKMPRDKRQMTRLIHWGAALQEYDYEIEHKPGRSMLFADPLSRDLPQAGSPRPVEEKTVTATQKIRAQALIVQCNSENAEHIAQLRETLADTDLCQRLMGEERAEPARVRAAAAPVQAEQQPTEEKKQAEKGTKPRRKSKKTEVKADPQEAVELPTREELRLAQEGDEQLGPIRDYLEQHIMPAEWDEWVPSKRDKWKQHAENFHVNSTNGLLYYCAEETEERHGLGLGHPPALLLAIPTGEEATKLSIAARITQAMHDDPMQAHFGFAKTIAKMQERFWWPSMAHDVRNHVRTCERCQKAKARIPKLGNRLNTITAEEPFEIIHIDLIESLQETPEGYKHILVIIDKFSKWPEFIPVKTKTAEELSAALTKYWVTHYGVPRTIIADNAKQFLGNLWRVWGAHMGAETRYTSPYHPQSNAQVERLNRVVKEALRAMCSTKPTSWPEYLAPLAFAYRTAVHSSTGFSPYQLLFGRQPVLPADAIYGDPAQVEAMEKEEGKHMLKLTSSLQQAWKLALAGNDEARLKQKHYHDQNVKQRTFEIGQLVLARAKVHTTGKLKKALMLPWTGPWVVVSKEGDAYQLRRLKDKAPNKSNKRVNVKDITPYHRRTLQADDANPLLVDAAFNVDQAQQGAEQQGQAPPQPQQQAVLPPPAAPAIAPVAEEREQPAVSAVGPQPKQAPPAEVIEQLPAPEQKEPIAQAVPREEEKPNKRKREPSKSSKALIPEAWSRIAKHRYDHNWGAHYYLVEPKPRVSGRTHDDAPPRVTMKWIDLASCTNPEHLAMIRAFNQQEGLDDIEMPIAVASKVSRVSVSGTQDELLGESEAAAAPDTRQGGSFERFVPALSWPVYLLDASVPWN